MWDKEKRETFLESISKIEKTKKGPADYANTLKNKIPGNYLLKTEKGSLMNEVSFLGSQSPSPTHYIPNYDKSSLKHRSPNANLNRCRSERPTCIPFKKIDAPNPYSYPEKDTKWKKLSWIEDHSSPFVFRKDKGGRFLDQVVKNKAYVPGVAKYSLETMQDKISKGP